MKRKIYIPRLAEIEFDFMQMKPDCFRIVDGEMKLAFELKYEKSEHKAYGLTLGINFNFNENAIDERFPNYRYTELESLYSIELYDFNIEYQFSEFVNSKLLQIAKAVMPRQYTEMQTIKTYSL